MPCWYFILIQTSHKQRGRLLRDAMKTMGFDDLVLVAPLPDQCVYAGGNQISAPAAERRWKSAASVDTLGRALDG